MLILLRTDDNCAVTPETRTKFPLKCVQTQKRREKVLAWYSWVLPNPSVVFGTLLCPVGHKNSPVPISYPHQACFRIFWEATQWAVRCLILFQNKQGKFWVRPAEISMGNLCPGCWLTASGPPELQDWVKGLVDKSLFVIQWLQGKWCDWRLLYLPVKLISVTRRPLGLWALLYMGTNPTVASFSYHGLAIKITHYCLLKIKYKLLSELC